MPSSTAATAAPAAKTLRFVMVSPVRKKDAIAGEQPGRRDVAGNFDRLVIACRRGRHQRFAGKDQGCDLRLPRAEGTAIMWQGGLMITFRIATDINEDRQVLLTLPPEVP